MTRTRLIRERKASVDGLPSRGFLQSLLEACVDGVIAYDKTMRCTYWNAAMSRLSGLEAHAAIGREVSTAVPFLREPVEAAALRAALNGETIVSRNRPFTSVDAKEQGFFDGSYVPLRDEEGDIIGGVAILRDVTETHQAEDELVKAVRARDEFMSIASHELRTPLTTMRLRLDGLVQRYDGAWKERPAQAEEVLPKLEAVRRQSERLEQLVNNLLDVSRITSGRMELNIEEFDLVELANDVIERFQSERGQLQSRIELDAHGPIHGAWDRFRLDQVLTNLIGNAIKYGDQKPIEVLLDSTSGTARIRILDHGIGIAAQDLPKIFERFGRAAPKRNFGGLGLGLWITRRLLTAMRGTISVASIPGEGSTFTVELPTV